MATKGSKTYSFTDYNDLVFSWNRTAVNEAANTSTIGWSLQLVSKEHGAISDSQQKFLSVRVNGNAYAKSDVNINIGNNTSRALISGQTTITHNLNGTGSFSFSVELKANTTFDGVWISNVEFSGTGELNRINRRSTITCADAYIEEEMLINISRYDSNFTHTLTYSFKETTGTIATKTSETTVSWYIPIDFWELMPTETEATCTLTCETYYGDTLIGISYAYPKILTGIIPPEFTVEFHDTLGPNWDLTGGSTRSIRYVSGSLYYEITATPARGATIADYKIVYGNKTYTGQSGYTDNSDHLTAAVTVTDSRGISNTENIALNMANYFYPTAILRVTKPTASGEATLEFEGAHFNQSFGAQNNSFTLEYRFKEEGGSYNSWNQVLQIRQTTTTYSATVSKTGLDYTKAYTFQARITDSITTAESPEITVRSTPVFDWGADDFAFNVPVSIQGNTVPTIVTQGKSGIWTYRTWSDGTAECWGKQDFTVNVTSQWGSMYTSGAISESNISFPLGLFAETPVVNASLLVRSAGGILMAPGEAESSIASIDQTGVYEIARGTSLSNAAYTINYDVKGRWK